MVQCIFVVLLTALYVAQLTRAYPQVIGNDTFFCSLKALSLKMTSI